MTKPVETAPAANGKPLAENCLSAADFALKDCKAGHRMLVMDSSLRNFDEDDCPRRKTALSGAT